MDQFLVEYAAGVAGGVAVVCVGHPFDTCKTRLQTAPPGFYKSTLDCVAKTYKREGFAGFYAGFMSPLAGQMFFRAASFSCFRMIIAKWPGSDVNPTSLELMRAGGITGLFITIIETPIDLVKTKLQVQIFGHKTPKYTTVLGCVKYLTNKHGLQCLWQGAGATAVRNVPAERKNIPTTELSVHHRLIAGACAGLCYWVGMYPLDAIKGNSQATAYVDRQGWLGTVRKMWRNGGISSFTKGFWACAARALPACSVMFTTVDIVREHLGEALLKPQKIS